MSMNAGGHLVEYHQSNSQGEMDGQPPAGALASTCGSGRNRSILDKTGRVICPERILTNHQRDRDVIAKVVFFRSIVGAESRRDL